MKPWQPASHWDEHPDYPVQDWIDEVLGENTRLGYSDWVNNQLDAVEEDQKSCCARGAYTHGWHHDENCKNWVLKF